MKDRANELNAEFAKHYALPLATLMSAYGYQPLWIVGVNNDGNLWIGLNPDLTVDPRYAQLVEEHMQELVSDIGMTAYLNGAR
jgi:hypothetical protein